MIIGSSVLVAPYVVTRYLCAKSDTHRVGYEGFNYHAASHLLPNNTSNRTTAAFCTVVLVHATRYVFFFGEAYGKGFFRRNLSAYEKRRSP